MTDRPISPVVPISAGCYDPRGGPSFSARPVRLPRGRKAMRAIAILLLGLGTAPAFAADPDETLLKGAGLHSDGSALLDFVRLRSREAIPAEELAPLLKDLASTD